MHKIRKIVHEQPIEEKICEYSYRPFDDRYVVYDKNIIDWPRMEVMQNVLKPNLLLSTHRNILNQSWAHVLVSVKLTDLHNLDSAIGSHHFPLYLYAQNGQISLLGSTVRRPNLNKIVTDEIVKSLELSWVSDHKDKKDDDHTKISPLDIYNYVYSILHSPKYRKKHNDSLKKYFPRVPYPKEKNVFWKLADLGDKLRSLHLMGNDPFGAEPEILGVSRKWGVEPKGQRDGSLDWKVEKVEYDDTNKRVYVNERQYFEGIEPEVWSFYIGGYQVMDKWLKDRKKTSQNLTIDDRLHYVKIAVVLRETIRIQKEIDATGFTDKITEQPTQKKHFPALRGYNSN